MLKMDLDSLHASYENEELSPTQVVETISDRIKSRGNDGVWTYVLPPDQILSRAADLESINKDERSNYPLWGVPFSVKDNIDVEGIPTTAACPEYSYMPKTSHHAVDRLLASGCILIGKTNLDQFATGLVGVRSPYGIARNPFNDLYLPGGSSSGAGVSVSEELVSFGLGTDTGGSGRVPASYTNTVGLKPTRGLLGPRATVWACRSLDCVSIYALNVKDAKKVLSIAHAYDSLDPYSRAMPLHWATKRHHSPFNFAMPYENQMEFFGSTESSLLYTEALQTMESLGGKRIEIDYDPFLEVNDMLFKGPILAERYVSFGKFFENNPEAGHPITRQIVLNSKSYTASDLISMCYRLQEIKRELKYIWQKANLLVLPTIPRPFTIEEVEKDPIGPNLQHGMYTNFVNLLDFAAIALPTGFMQNGVPYGISIIGPAFSDSYLADLGEKFQKERKIPLGARNVP